MVIPDNEMHREIGPCEKVREESYTTASSSTFPLVNIIPGRVTALHQGLLNMGIRKSRGTDDLRVRWPLDSLSPEPVPGLSIKAVIPAEAVHLESGYFRLGKRRWNRWIGRIVLVEMLQHKQVVSVKLHHDPITLKCCGSMTGSNWIPQVWDIVNIVVDPTKIGLDAGIRNEPAQPVPHDGETFDPFRDARVWLSAQVKEIGEAPEGKFLSLMIGTARVSVFIGREEDSFDRWESDMTLEIHVGRYDAWLKPCGHTSPPVLCGLLYLDSQSLANTR